MKYHISIAQLVSSAIVALAFVAGYAAARLHLASDPPRHIPIESCEMISPGRMDHILRLNQQGRVGLDQNGEDITAEVIQTGASDRKETTVLIRSGSRQQFLQKLPISPASEIEICAADSSMQPGILVRGLSAPLVNVKLSASYFVFDAQSGVFRRNELAFSIIPVRGASGGQQSI